MYHLVENLAVFHVLHFVLLVALISVHIECNMSTDAEVNKFIFILVGRTATHVGTALLIFHCVCICISFAIPRCFHLLTIVLYACLLLRTHRLSMLLIVELCVD